MTTVFLYLFSLSSFFAVVIILKWAMNMITLL